MKNTIRQVALIAWSISSIFIWGGFIYNNFNYLDKILSFADIDTSLNTYFAAMEFYSFTLIRNFFITFAYTKVISIIKNCIIEFLDSIEGKDK